MVDYSHRLIAHELMDEPSVSPEDLRGALRDLGSINRFLGGHRASIDGALRLLPKGCRQFSLLDVGCGSGDFARELASSIRSRRISVKVHGIDLSPVAVAHAVERTRGLEELTFQPLDLFAMGGADRFDIVHAGLVLHHFNGEDAFLALQAMCRLARWGVVVNDLHRHPIAYHSFRWLSQVIWRNRLVRTDGPISVLRGFRRFELTDLAQRLDIASAEVHWRWAFRWLLLIRKGPTQ